MTTYGFIGAGNMAGAIVDGLIASGHSGGTTVWSAHDSASALAARTGVRLAPSAEQLVGTSDVVIARKPLVVSIAAGLTTTRLESLLPDGTRVVRAMPNMAAAVRESMTALTAGTAASEEDLELTASLMGRVGRTIVLDEKDFSAFTALAGSSPAFIFTFIEALARGGVDAGLPKARAVEIVTQALLGSASMVRREAERRAEDGTGRTLADLLDTACSPGGTTVAGLIAMEGAGFSPAVIEAVRAAIARDRALGV